MANIFNLTAEEDIIGIVMKYESAGSLEKYIYRSHAQSLISDSDKLYILKNIVKAVGELHNLNIVHGDLKPANILLSTHQPPEIRLCDFGLSFCNEKLDLARSLNNSSLFMTTTSRGTPIYKCPEMIVNPLNESFSELVARASKKTDMYSFSVLAWEVLTLTKPFANCKSEVMHSTLVHQGVRPDLGLLPLQFRNSIATMIESCWSADRKERKTAVECFSILDHTYQILKSKNFDIFLSHTWSSKPFLSRVYMYLASQGFRVWYDQNEMGHDMIGSMSDGIANSKYFIACISQTYQASKFCMFEFETAVNKNANSVILINIESDADTWLMDKIQKLKRKNNYLDFCSLANEDWEDEAGPDAALLDRVNSALSAMAIQLKALGCKPALVHNK
jgi:serine/threonine protein kinase